MPTIEEWDRLAHGIADYYTAPEGLGRDAESISIGEMANWLYWWREHGKSLDWITYAIRTDPAGEWRAKHPGDDPGTESGSAPTPQTPAPPPSTPEPSTSAPILDLKPNPFRVSDESDGELVNRGYSYYPAAWVSAGSIYVFAGARDGNPRLWRMDIASREVHRLGWPFSYRGETEGWYWDLDGWIYLINGSQLRRVQPFTGEDRQVFSIEDTHPGCDLWQTHSSEDGRVHSATVRQIVNDGKYPYIGTVVVVDGAQTFFDASGDLDESQITPDGGWVVIKEKVDGLLRNRVIEVRTRITQTLTNATGAVGHSDCGDGILVGEWSPQHGEAEGQCVLWDLRQPLVPERRRHLFQTWSLGHVSVRGGRCLRSDERMLSLVHLGSGTQTPVLEHGMVGSGYDYQVFANLSPCGRVATYMSNVAGRMDVYLIVLG